MFALLQEPEDEKRFPVGYCSRTLHQAERNNSATQRECLGVVCSILHRRTYLEITKFTVSTSHHALEWALFLSNAEGRQAKLRLRLAGLISTIPIAHGRNIKFRMHRLEQKPQGENRVPCMILSLAPAPSLRTSKITTQCRIYSSKKRIGTLILVSRANKEISMQNQYQRKNCYPSLPAYYETGHIVKLNTLHLTERS